MNKSRVCVAWAAVSAVATFVGGCATSSSGGEAPSSHAQARTEIELPCPTSDKVPNARYIGPYHGVENNLTSKDMAQDLYCAEQFKQKNFPKGFVTVFGSSRIKETNTSGDAALNAANNKLYQQVRTFAYDWSKKFGAEYPILSGAGPGLMEAANRGAKEAGAHSIGYTTYYDPPTTAPTPDRPYGGNPAKVFSQYDSKDITTDGLIFSSIAMRETMMILHSAAIVIAPGGTGTEWETFQVLETVKSKQLTCVPIYFVGEGDLHWKAFKDRLSDMVRRGTLVDGQLTPYIEFVDNAEDLPGKVAARIGKPCP